MMFSGEVLGKKPVAVARAAPGFNTLTPSQNCLTDSHPIL
jgi:hypothetical protein